MPAKLHNYGKHQWVILKGKRGRTGGDSLKVSELRYLKKLQLPIGVASPLLHRRQ